MVGMGIIVLMFLVGCCFLNWLERVHPPFDLDEAKQKIDIECEAKYQQAIREIEEELQQ